MFSALSIEQGLDDDSESAVPEAYRLKFRTHKKSVHQTFVEITREKKSVFDSTCTNVTTLDQLQLQELIC